MATLNYISESRKFVYIDGDYTLTGNKVIEDGAMSAIDTGKITKSESSIGNFYVRFGDSFSYNVSLSSESEFSTVNTKVIALIAALRQNSN